MCLCKDPIKKDGIQSFKAKITNLRDKEFALIGASQGYYNNHLSACKDNWSYSSSGDKHILGAKSPYGSVFLDGDEIEVRVLIKENWIEFLRNGKS